jgi:DNA repair protein RadD
MQLRDYQQEAHDAIINWIRKTVDPCIVDIAPAGGKSHVIAAVAETLHQMSNGKKILCLAPSKELVEQNHEKFLMTGAPASIFSASAGKKCLRHPVIYGTPVTVKNSISRFGKDICLIVYDEAHEWGATAEFIIDKIRDKNPLVRVLGLSGTPFRTKEGYIYKIDEHDRVLSEDVARKPYFTKCVHRVPAKIMLERGFLCPMKVEEINTEAYDTSMLVPNGFNKFTDKELDRAFVGKGRKTSLIVADVIRVANRHPGGVMLFAATRQHAYEIYESLPKGKSAVITGDPKKKAQRKRDIDRYKKREIRYLVSVGTLTTGFDSPWTSIIALLRKMESPSLVQQMLGRAWRPWDKTKEGFIVGKDVPKDSSILLDYGGNIEDHFPDGDIYAPEIRPTFTAKDNGAPIPSLCTSCNTVNEFNARPNPDGLGYDEEGYFTDLMGNRVMTDIGPIPGHYGRRCRGMSLVQGEFVQCSHRWTFKECPECKHENDIAARYCKECKAEIIDPNEKLIVDFKRYKRDPTNIQTDKVLSANIIKTVTRKGEECIRVDYKTEYRSFSIWYFPSAVNGFKKVEYNRLMEATNNRQDAITTITYKKDSKSGFYKVFAYNEPADEV